MPAQRTLSYRWTARFMAAWACVCLLSTMAARPAQALDAGDGTVISPQQPRRPLGFDSGKAVRLDGRDGAGNARFASKAELSVTQEYSMTFGSLCKKSGSVVLGTDDAIIEDINHLVFGGVTYAAVIRLEGDPWVAVTIEISAPPDPGFTLSDFDTSLGQPPLFGQALDESGNLSFRLGARLTLDADNITVGPDQEISYTVTAFYE